RRRRDPPDALYGRLLPRRRGRRRAAAPTRAPRLPPRVRDRRRWRRPALPPLDARFRPTCDRRQRRILAPRADRHRRRLLDVLAPRQPVLDGHPGLRLRLVLLWRRVGRTPRAPGPGPPGRRALPAPR